MNDLRKLRAAYEFILHVAVASKMVKSLWQAETGPTDLLQNTDKYK